MKARPPFTWERFIETLLSERMLNAMLFLGALLLFAAALSLVAYWDRFPSWLQVTFLGVFTGIFYGLGWYVLTKLKLRGSGIALSAVASLLVPLDFYAFYRFGGFPKESWPQVWLLASLVCLGAYTLTALLVQAEFFGYLAALAAGSTLAAAMQVGNVPKETWQAALSGLALLVALAGEGLLRGASGRWKILGQPFWWSALLGSFVILMLSGGWALVDGSPGRPYLSGMAASWWLAGLTYLLALGRHRSGILGLAAAAIFPGAVLLSEYLYFEPRRILPTWYALGLALLVPLYLLAGHFFKRREPWRRHAQVMSAGGAGLAVVAALLPLSNFEATALIHPWLAASMILAARLWQQPRLLYLTSLLLLSGSTALVSSRELPAEQSGLAWALLAILHTIAALLVEKRRAKKPGAVSYAAPLYQAGWVLAGLAVLPPLFSVHYGLLSYTLGNWIALNGWLAYQAHQAVRVDESHTKGARAPRPYAGFAGMKRVTPLFFLWSAAAVTPLWLLFTWLERISDSPAVENAILGLLYVAAGWLMLLVGVWIRRIRWQYQRPWTALLHVQAAIGLLVGLQQNQQKWLTLCLLLAAALYFAAALLLNQSHWLFVGGALLPFGWALGLDWLHLAEKAQPAGLGLLALVYILAVQAVRAVSSGWGAWRRPQLRAGAPRPYERFMRRMLTRPWLRPLHSADFLQPLYLLAQMISLAAFLWGLRIAARSGEQDDLLLWAAGANLLLALVFAALAWIEQTGWEWFVGKTRLPAGPRTAGAGYTAHFAVWMGVIAAGLAAQHFSRGSGRSAFLAALLAAALILGERGLLKGGLALRLSRPWRTWARSAWQRFAQPLIIAGWSVSAGTIFLALVRNLALLGGGRTRINWSILALLTICGLYAAGAYFYRQRRRTSLTLTWLAAALVIAPWTLLARQGWYIWPRTDPPRYAIAWLALALLELLLGIEMRLRCYRHAPRWQDLSRPPRWVAHPLAAFALLWSSANAATASLTFGMGLGFYLLGVWGDVRRVDFGKAWRFLYPAAYLIPIWSVYLLAHFAPQAPQTAYGALLLGLSLPLLAVGRWIEKRQPHSAAIAGWRFALPLYFAAYTCLPIGTALVAHERPALIAALLFDTLVCGFSAWLFRQPLWVYPASATLPGAMLLWLAEYEVPAARQGWALIACGALYMVVAYLLRARTETQINEGRSGARRADYAPPLIAAGFALTTLGLPVSSGERPEAIVAYGAAVLIYAASAFWLRQPLLLTPAAGLAIVPYWLGLLEMGLQPLNYGLALAPLAPLALGVAVLLERWKGALDGALPSFPWFNPFHWLQAAADGLLRRWALPFDLLAYIAIGLGALLSIGEDSRQTLSFSLAALVYAHAIYRFRLRGWLLAAAICGQLAGLSLVGWISPTPPSFAGAALGLAPFVWATLLGGLALEYSRKEGPPLRDGKAGWLSIDPRGWSRPLYLLVLVDLVLCQLASLWLGPESAWVSLSNALMLGVMACAWQSPLPAYAGLALGTVALFERLAWLERGVHDWAWNLALLTLAYGLAGYSLRYLRLRWKRPLPAQAAVWEGPLCQAGWLLSGFSLLLGLALFIDNQIIRLAVRAAMGLGWELPPNTPGVRSFEGVLALVGLFYLAVAAADAASPAQEEQDAESPPTDGSSPANDALAAIANGTPFPARLRRWLAYLALGMLLTAWSCELLIVRSQRELQLYALPAGFYLLLIGYMEWKTGSRALARWADRFAILLLLGSSFWQSLGDTGGRYAMLMGGVSLLLLWWGSARRLRRFLYAGVAGMTLDVAGQLIEPLLSANRWIVFGVAGAILVSLAIFVERRLETVMGLSQDLRQRLEKWE